MVHKIAERLKLNTFSCFTIAVPLVILLGLVTRAFNVSLFSVPNSIILRNLPNPNNIPTFEVQTLVENPSKPVEISDEHEEKGGEEEEETCNLFEGKWIYNPEVSPLYKPAQCPFLSEQVSCRKNGRPDNGYEKWTWEPKGCQNTRNNNSSVSVGRQMLEKLRDKRVVIVGDSLNRNQWESLACLLYSALPSSSHGYVDVKSSAYKIFIAKGFNCSVEFYWSPFLVEREVNRRNGNRIVKVDQLVSTAKKWKGAHIMVFNTGHWWSHHGKHQSWDVFHSKGKAVEMDTESALGLAMETWSHWIDKNVNTNKTKVFFRSISPEHNRKKRCYNQTQPVTDESDIARYHNRMSQVVENKLREMKTPVLFLNITELSQYRRDGHPSIFRNAQGKGLVAMNELRPDTFSDCSHWCLPGVPDTWNTLLLDSITPETSKAVTFS